MDVGRTCRWAAAHLLLDGGQTRRSGGERAV